MQRSTFRLSQPFQAIIYISVSVLLITGAAWMILHSPVEQTTNSRNISAQLMRIHGAAAMAVLVVLGALTPHIRRGWKEKKNRFTGVLMIAVNLFLVLSGYGLYYAGNEKLRAWLSCSHGWIGLGIAIVLPAHVITGRMIIRRLHLRKAASMPRRKIVRQPHKPLL